MLKAELRVNTVQFKVRSHTTVIQIIQFIKEINILLMKMVLHVVLHEYILKITKTK